MMGILKRLIATVLFAVLLLYPTMITARGSSGRGPIHNYRKFAAPVLAKVDTTVSRSFTIPSTQGYGLAMVYLWHEDHVTLSRVYMDCTGLYDTRDYVLQDCTLGFGDCSSDNARWHTRAAITATKLWPWRIDIMGFERIDCTLTFTGGSAGDSIEVDAAMMTQ